MPMFHRVIALAIFLFSAVGLVAQEREPQLPLPADDVFVTPASTANKTAEPESSPRDFQATTQGTFGLVQASPNITATLGRSDNQAYFRVFSANDFPILHVGGDGTVEIKHTAAAASTGLRVEADQAIAANVSQTDYALFAQAEEAVPAGVENTGGLYGGRIRSFLNGAGSLTTAYGLRVDAGAITGSVNLAIGAWLQVTRGTGSIGTAYALYVPDVTATNDYAIFQVGADDSNHLAGDLGIGTIARNTKLHIHDTAQLPRVILSGTEYYQGGENTKEGVGLYLGSNRTSNRHVWFGDTASATPFLRIATGTASPMIDAVARDGSTPSTLSVGFNGNVAMVTGTGRVGIGTAAPNSAYKLDVAGKSLFQDDAQFNGDAHFVGTVTGANIRATYQDVAEWVPATTDLEPGTVVVLNTARNNEVMASATSYDTRVAGVVSAQPGLSLGIEGKGKEQIATYGRVKVKVDATRSPIAVGDLLVTSATPGTAMRSEPVDINGRSFHQPGTIIGKALEPLAGGVGEILVLLSMQ
jgi:hypothetical protein